MAAVGRLCASVAWRAAWRGYISLPVNRSGYTNLAWALQTHCYISAPCSVTVQQSRQNSFFNKLFHREICKQFWGYYYQIMEGNKPSCGEGKQLYCVVCASALHHVIKVVINNVNTAAVGGHTTAVVTADELWKGVLANTALRPKKGRGKRTKKRIKKDLNKGQVLGEGLSGFLWPGLNAPVMAEGQMQAISQSNRDQKEIQAEIIRRRVEWEKKRKVKVKKERGWTGRSWGGMSLGCPDPGPNGVDDALFNVTVSYQKLQSGKEKYEDFDCQILQLKHVACMTGRDGRKKSVSALVVVGNGNGAAGFAVGRAKDRVTALRKAKNQAINYLHYIERYQNHTIYHDITTTFKKTTIQMRRRRKGHGLRCHRAIISICKLIGITDMYAKLRGSHNMLNLTRALFKGLANQKTHQDLANEKGLHVVEFREEQGPLPLLMASPQGTVRKDPETTANVPDVKLEWNEVRVAHGLRHCSWSNVKRTGW